MIGQTADLFGETPPRIARRRDPRTSKQAAVHYAKTNLGNDQTTMLELIRECPGMTAGEYGQILMSRGVAAIKATRMPGRRIPELRKAGKIVISAERKCSISGRRAQTYEAVQ